MNRRDFFGVTRSPDEGDDAAEERHCVQQRVEQPGEDAAARVRSESLLKTKGFARGLYSRVRGNIVFVCVGVVRVGARGRVFVLKAHRHQGQGPDDPYQSRQSLRTINMSTPSVSWPWMVSQFSVS